MALQGSPGRGGGGAEGHDVTQHHKSAWVLARAKGTADPSKGSAKGRREPLSRELRGAAPLTDGAGGTPREDEPGWGSAVSRAR